MQPASFTNKNWGITQALPVDRPAIGYGLCLGRPAPSVPRDVRRPRGRFSNAFDTGALGPKNDFVKKNTNSDSGPLTPSVCSIRLASLTRS